MLWGASMKRGSLNHPKIRKLARLIDMPPFAAMGLVEALTHWAFTYATDGGIGKFDDDEIADGVGWNGEPSAMMDALYKAKLIAKHAHFRWVIHDWHEHADTATHMAMARAQRWFWDGQKPKLGNFGKAEKLAITESYEDDCAPSGYGPALPWPQESYAEATSLPLPSPPFPALPSLREGAGAPSATNGKADSPPKPPKMLPIEWSQSDGFAGITHTDRENWAAAYPACDLDRQIAAAHAWLVANPAKAKKRSYRRYITGWLARAQERGGDTQSNRPGGDLEQKFKDEAEAFYGKGGGTA